MEPGIPADWAAPPVLPPCAQCLRGETDFLGGLGALCERLTLAVSAGLSLFSLRHLRRKDFLQLGQDLYRVFELAFPDDQYTPARALEAMDVPAVVRDVPGGFLRPESPVALGGGGALAALVPMPEAAMDEFGKLTTNFAISANKKQITIRCCRVSEGCVLRRGAGCCRQCWMRRLWRTG